MFKTTCSLSFERGNLVALVEPDLLKYLYWLVQKGTYNCYPLQTPAFKPHVTIVSKYHHGVTQANIAGKLYHGKQITFEYDPTEIFKGGESRNFINFWMKMYSNKADRIKKNVKAKDKRFLGYHLTICNTKNYVNSYKKT